MKYRTQIKKVIEDVKRGEHPYVVCPKCGKGNMQYGYRGSAEWNCIWIDCCFSTDEIPSEEYIRHLIQLKEDLKLIKKYKI